MNRRSHEHRAQTQYRELWSATSTQLSLKYIYLCVSVRIGYSVNVPPASRKPRTRSNGTEDDYLFWAEFRYQIRLWMRISEEAALDAGLPPQHHQVLLAIKGFPGDGPPLITDLAERMQLRHHSMVGLLDRMEKQGLIERVPIGSGRGVSIIVTPEGDRALDEVSRTLRSGLRVAGRDLIDALQPLVEPRKRGVSPASATRSRTAPARTRPTTARPRASQRRAVGEGA
jgi:DNA-binding MarR family transcriptional regulator